jgi:hypothetical protein
LRQMAIVSACCLRTVEPTLTWIGSRRLNIRHGDAPLFGKAISLSVYLPSLSAGGSVKGMYGPPRDCKGYFGREDKSAQMYSSIRAKALSRVKMSCRCLSNARSQGFRDQGSSEFSLNHFRWNVLHQPSIRPRSAAMIPLFGHPAYAGCESAYSASRSGFR